MIRNERQYRITKAQAEKFGKVLTQLQTLTPDPKVHPKLWKAQQDALRSQIDELDTQIAEFEALRSGKRQVLEVESFHELPNALIQARIAAGLSQKDLAERLGLKEQQIQLYESTEYASASFTRIAEVVEALGIQVREDVFLPTAQVTKDRLFRRLQTIGIERDFVLQTLPKTLATRLETETNPTVASKIVLKAAAAVGRVYSLKPADIFRDVPLSLNHAALAEVRHKIPANANELNVSVHTVYAHYMAMLALQVTPDLPKGPLPADALSMHREILSNYGAMTFENTLQYIWSLGIPVLPLKISGGFHGACWRENGRNIIVLKQRTDYAARWLFDAIHEFDHARKNPDEMTLGVIDFEDNIRKRRDAQEEQEADQFAIDTIFGGQADNLAVQCRRQAGIIPHLKTVVPQVARNARVPVSSLAYHVAYLLSEIGEDWWGAATNLQTMDNDPLQFAREMFLQHAKLSQCNEMDRSLLVQALSN